MKKIPLIEAHDVRMTFGPTQILRGVDLTVHEGEIVSIMGPSGSGKSTLLYCLAGIITTETGGVTYSGRTITTLKRSEAAKLRRTDFGFIFQFGELVPELPVRDNIALPLLLRGVGKRTAYTTAEEWIDLVGLTSVARAFPHTLSGGEVQRAAIARAMVIDPKVIFADEPTGSLDSANSKKVMELLVGIADKYRKTIVMVTHSPEVAAYADRMIMLRDGLIESESLAV